MLDELLGATVSTLFGVELIGCLMWKGLAVFTLVSSVAPACAQTVKEIAHARAPCYNFSA